MILSRLVSIKRDSLGRFMNPWEIPAEAVIYARAKESMRSGSGPRFSIRHGTHAKHKHQMCNLSEGSVAIGWIIQRLIPTGERSGLLTRFTFAQNGN